MFGNCLWYTLLFYNFLRDISFTPTDNSTLGSITSFPFFFVILHDPKLSFFALTVKNVHYIRDESFTFPYT